MRHIDTLEALLRNYAKRSGSRWWLGTRPQVRRGEMAKAVAQKVGLPTATFDPLAIERMVALTLPEAAHVLAVAATTSLAYGNRPPSSGALAQAKHALGLLKRPAAFLSNGRWLSGPTTSWTPLTTSTFDCGLIGYDDECAFVFWVEEED